MKELYYCLFILFYYYYFYYYYYFFIFIFYYYNFLYRNTQVIKIKSKITSYSNMRKGNIEKTTLSTYCTLRT